MMDYNNEMILGYFECCRMEMSYRTAEAAISIISYIHVLEKVIDATPEEDKCHVLPTIEVRQHDNRWWIIGTIDGLHELVSHIPMTTMRRLLKRLDYENILNMHVFDKNKGIVGFSLHDQIRKYLK